MNIQKLFQTNEDWGSLILRVSLGMVMLPLNLFCKTGGRYEYSR